MVSFIWDPSKEYQLVCYERWMTCLLQPAVEIISFRLAELRGLARWRSRFQNVGLDEKLIYGVTEKIGMLVVQVERFSRVAATVLYLVPFFSACFLAMFSILNLCFNLGLLPEIPLPGQVHRTFCVLEVLVDNIDWTHICLLIWHWLLKQPITFSEFNVIICTLDSRFCWFDVVSEYDILVHVVSAEVRCHILKLHAQHH